MSKVSNLLVLTTNAIIPSYRNDWTIIGKFSELTDEQCEEFVEHSYILTSEVKYVYLDYCSWEQKMFDKPTAKESLKSRLKYEGIDVNENDFIVKLND